MNKYENRLIRGNRLKHVIKKLHDLLKESKAISPNYQKYSISNTETCLYLYFNQSEGYAEKLRFDFYSSKEPLQVDEIKMYSLINYMDDIINTSSNATKRQNLPIVFVVADKAMKSDMTKKVFTDKVNTFFSADEYRNTEYCSYTMSASARKDRVQKRIKLLWDAIN
ncbi:hypothetical protein [Paenibacillus polymyxa]|uniref:Uncharacterized protein n=1 Tax=Paenibacillus polymyxa (strain SC2) TaxID=886882 RepID=E3EL48_PAEPS|nr:hypothetical protein [Paenibacillus polymyxa]ADO59610.1 hypothetical protein PPSC2_27090 [Paenibacillus polymyxa SC2]WPQ59567.1 hypothetical protein SKN87_28295 [Paenibacillus polymyxa]